MAETSIRIDCLREQPYVFRNHTLSVLPIRIHNSGSADIKLDMVEIQQFLVDFDIDESIDRDYSTILSLKTKQFMMQKELHITQSRNQAIKTDLVIPTQTSEAWQLRVKIDYETQNSYFMISIRLFCQQQSEDFFLLGLLVNEQPIKQLNEEFKEKSFTIENIGKIILPSNLFFLNGIKQIIEFENICINCEPECPQLELEQINLLKQVKAGCEEYSSRFLNMKLYNVKEQAVSGYEDFVDVKIVGNLIGSQYTLFEAVFVPIFLCAEVQVQFNITRPYTSYELEVERVRKGNEYKWSKQVEVLFQ